MAKRMARGKVRLIIQEIEHCKTEIFDIDMDGLQLSDWSDSEVDRIIKVLDEAITKISGYR